MNTEIELKFAVAPRDMPAALRLRWLRPLVSGRASRSKLISVYFDTPKLKLRQHGVSLRVRKAGRKRLQTIKTHGSSGTGRKEWEEEIAGDMPDLKLAKDTALARLVGGKLKRSLQPVFTTEVQRTVMPLRVGDSELELAFDRGQINTGQRRAPISEIEIELKRGDRAELARLAERLSTTIPLSYAAQAKSERGYALRSGESGKPVGAATIVLERGMSTGAAFSAIGLSCLHQVAANGEAVRNGESEGVHQMRVGLRRLRAAISVFKDLVAGAETEDVKTNLKWLTEQLGPARDLDVLVDESVAPLCKTGPGRQEVRLLESDLKRKRDRGFGQAKAAVESARYREVILATALWLINGGWITNADPAIAARLERSARPFARDVLRQRTKEIIKRAGKLEHLEARERHRLRIAVKKLRYATHFFASLFTKAKATRARKSYEEALEALQDSLGTLNDMAVHEKMARQFAHPRKDSKKRPEKAFAMGLLTGREQPQARACMAAASKAGRKLAKARPFWR